MKAYSVKDKAETNRGVFNLIKWRVTWPIEALSELAAEAVVRGWFKDNLYLLNKQENRPTELWVADSIRAELDELIDFLAEKYQIKENKAETESLLEQIRKKKKGN